MANSENIIKCPKCNINMGKISKKGVTLDKCKKCGGIWFDRNELDKLYSMEARR